MSSFLKYQSEETTVKGNGRGSLSFARAAVDGMPFRGQTALLKEEEYDEFTEVVQDFDVGLFDIGIPKERAALKVIFDKAANQWYQILDYDKKWITKEDGTTTVIVYIAYSIPHRELDQRRLDSATPTAVPQFPDMPKL